MTAEILPPHSEQEPKFRGISNYDVTTSAWLFNPEQALAVTDELNSDRPKDRWVGIELYSTISPKILSLAKRMGVPIARSITPDRVTPEKIREWQKVYTHTKISRVHLEFSFDAWETYFHRPTIGENVFPLKDGAKQRMFQLAWIYFIGPATSMRGVNLAESLEVGVNAHTNVIEGFAKRGKLEEIKKRLPFILAENERPYRSPHLHRQGITSQELASNPSVIRKEFVDKYQLGGLLLGIDHATEQGFDPAAELTKNADVVRAVHLASTDKSQGTHAYVRVGDSQISRFLETAANIEFPEPVSVALDYNPMDFMKIPFHKQLEIVGQTFNWLESTQSH